MILHNGCRNFFEKVKNLDVSVNVMSYVSFDYEGLYSVFVKLSSHEGQAVSRIFDSGVLKGISLEDIKQAGKCMILHNGCMSFFEKVNNLDMSVNIMSCWSGDLTRSALSDSPFMNTGKIPGSKPFLPIAVTHYFHPIGGGKKLKLGIRRPAAIGPYRCRRCNKGIAPDRSLYLYEHQAYGREVRRTLYKSTARLHTVTEGESSNFLWEDGLSLSQVHMKEIYLICDNQQCGSLIGFRYVSIPHRIFCFIIYYAVYLLASKPPFNTFCIARLQREVSRVAAPGNRKRKLSLVSFTRGCGFRQSECSSKMRSHLYGRCYLYIFT
ncbi:hypothetical protein MKW92_045609 [Papaver armeniacum]|nr:hypothetical protein MKW92_045609 [Papaver armeniacum]